MSRETLQIHSGKLCSRGTHCICPRKLCKSTQGNSALEELKGRVGGRNCRSTQGTSANYRERPADWPNAGRHNRRTRLKDSAKAYTQQVYGRSTSGKLCAIITDPLQGNSVQSTTGKTADPLQGNSAVQGNSADPLRETLQIH